MTQNPLSADLIHILDHTRSLWEDLRGARIFITGGTGFFGCWLLESFLFANQQLNLKASASVLTRRPDSVRQTLPHLMLDPAVTLNKGDVRNFEFPKGEYSHIIHAATEGNPQNNIIDPLNKFISNIEGTRRILDFAHSSGASRFLFTSSGAVYGKQPSDVTHVPETYSGVPETNDINSSYGQSKRASEFLCNAYSQKFGFHVSIARCFAFVGPRLPLDSNYAIGNFIRDAMKGVPIEISGDGTPYRSYLYAADLAVWLWTILLRGKSCYPYNVGSESDLSIVDLARMVANSIAPGLSIKIARQHGSDEPIERYVPLTYRAKSELGLQELIKLPDAIQRTMKWRAL